MSTRLSHVATCSLQMGSDFVNREMVTLSINKIEKLADVKGYCHVLDIYKFNC